MKNNYTELYQELFGREVIADVIDDYIIHNDGGYVISKYVKQVIERCETENELAIAEDMFIAILGWSFDSLIRDTNKFKGGYFTDDGN